MVDLIESLEDGPGYKLLSMGIDEYSQIKSLIYDQYIGNILNHFPDKSAAFAAHAMKHYHEFSDLVDHRALWPKRNRILGPGAVAAIKEMPFFKKLDSELNIIRISGEENSGWEEMYWRIVRPGNSDVGDLHADKWFWDMGHGEILEDTKRVKIWIAIEVDMGKNGLRVVPHSHKKHDWKYHGEVDHTGVAKPKFDEDESTLNIESVMTAPGDIIVFHDSLIHAGMENASEYTRVSIEATLLCKH